MQSSEFKIMRNKFKIKRYQTESYEYNCLNDYKKNIDIKDNDREHN